MLDLDYLKMSDVFLSDFLKTHTIKDVMSEVEGELPEHSTELATYAFGNSELICYPSDSEEAIVWLVDTYGDKSYFVIN